MSKVSRVLYLFCLFGDFSVFFSNKIKISLFLPYDDIIDSIDTAMIIRSIEWIVLPMIISSFLHCKNVIIKI